MKTSLCLHRILVNDAFPSGYIRYVVSLSFILALSPALAHDIDLIGTGTSDSSSISLQGFGTLGLARTSNDNAHFIRDVTQPNGVGKNWSGLVDSIAGLQTNYRYNDPTQIVVQAVSHYRYDGSFTPEFTRALIRYEWTPRVTMTVGRIGTEFLMQSDSRMVGYSYLTVRPNPDYFGGIPINYADGMDVGYHMPFGGGNLEGSLFAGTARERLTDYPLDSSHIQKATLGYSYGNWQMRYLYGRISLANSVDSVNMLESLLIANGASNSANILNLNGTKDQYNSLGVMYDDGSTQLQAGFSDVSHESIVYENADTWYVLVGERHKNYTPFVGYSSARSRSKNFDTGNAILNSFVDPFLQSSHQGGHTLTLGSRWDFARNLDLKVQVDFIGGGDGTSLLMYDNIKAGSWDGRMTVYSLAMDFVF